MPVPVNNTGIVSAVTASGSAPLTQRKPAKNIVAMAYCPVVESPDGEGAAAIATTRSPARRNCSVRPFNPPNNLCIIDTDRIIIIILKLFHLRTCLTVTETEVVDDRSYLITCEFRAVEFQEHPSARTGQRPIPVLEHREMGLHEFVDFPFDRPLVVSGRDPEESPRERRDRVRSGPSEASMIVRYE